jgi:hypothetical protein
VRQCEYLTKTKKKNILKYHGVFMKNYKVLSLLKDFSGKFETEKIEQTLNTLAKEGWKVVSCVSGNFYFGTAQSEFAIILEKDV